MSVSRDEAREIAITALLLVTVLRLASGLVQVYEEASREWTASSLVGRLVAPVGSTAGILVLAASMIAVLSPAGSVTAKVRSSCKWVALLVAALGSLSVFNSFAFGPSDVSTRIWFAMINGFAATLLGGAAWWILHSLDPNR